METWERKVFFLSTVESAIFLRRPATLPTCLKRITSPGLSPSIPMPVVVVVVVVGGGVVPVSKSKSRNRRAVASCAGRLRLTGRVVASVLLARQSLA